MSLRSQVPTNTLLALSGVVRVCQLTDRWRKVCQLTIPEGSESASGWLGHRAGLDQSKTTSVLAGISPGTALGVRQRLQEIPAPNGSIPLLCDHCYTP